MHAGIVAAKLAFTNSIYCPGTLEDSQIVTGRPHWPPIENPSRLGIEYGVPRIPTLETISRVARAIGSEEDELHSGRRGRQGSRGRGMVAYLARRLSRYTVREIADHFRRSSVTVSEAIMKVEDLLRKDIAFAKALGLLSENLIKGRKRKYRITEAF